MYSTLRATAGSAAVKRRPVVAEDEAGLRPAAITQSHHDLHGQHALSLTPEKRVQELLPGEEALEKERVAPAAKSGALEEEVRTLVDHTQALAVQRETS